MFAESVEIDLFFEARDVRGDVERDSNSGPRSGTRILCPWALPWNSYRPYTERHITDAKKLRTERLKSGPGVLSSMLLGLLTEQYRALLSRLEPRAALGHPHLVQFGFSHGI